MADLKGDATERAKPPEPEKDEPEDRAWPEQRKIDSEQALSDAYGGLTLEADMIPNLYIMNRLDRNWRNKSPELIQFAKMDNNAEHELIIENQ